MPKAVCCDQLMSILTHRKTSVIQPVRMLSNAALNQNTTTLKTIAYQLYHGDWVHHNNLQNVSNQTSKDFRMKCCFPTHLFNKDRTYNMKQEPVSSIKSHYTYMYMLIPSTEHQHSTMYLFSGITKGMCWVTVDYIVCFSQSYFLNGLSFAIIHTYIHTYSLTPLTSMLAISLC